MAQNAPFWIAFVAIPFEHSVLNYRFDMEEQAANETHRLRNYYRFWRSSDKYDGVRAFVACDHA